MVSLLFLSRFLYAETWTSLGPYGGGSFAGSAINPANVLQVVAVTNNPGNCYRSSDGGQTWTRSALITTSTIQDVASFGFSRIYVLTSNRCYRSTDGGLTWSYATLPATAGTAYALAVHPTDPNKVYAAGSVYMPTLARYSLSFIKSSDGGQSWTAATYLSFGSLTPYGMAVARTNPDLLYVCGLKYDTNWTAYGAVLRSTNGGSAWTDISSTVEPNPWYYFYAAAIDPADANRVYIVGDYVYRSTNGGATWTRGSLYVSGGAVAVDPNQTSRLYMGGYGEILVSSNYGQTWQAEPIASSAWGTHVAVAPVSGSPVYCSTDAGLYRSDDAGANWKEAHDGIPNSIIPCIAVAPSQPSTVFVESQNFAVMASTDSGGTWTEKGYFLSCGNVCDLLVHPTNPAVVLALEGDG